MKKKLKVKSSDNMLSYSNLPRIELVGNSECTVEGMKGIIEYTKEKIKINLGKYYVTFFGDELFIKSFSYQGAIVQGNIISVEFENYG